jgi:hypothetical protein
MKRYREAAARAVSSRFLPFFAFPPEKLIEAFFVAYSAILLRGGDAARPGLLRLRLGEFECAKRDLSPALHSGRI